MIHNPQDAILQILNAFITHVRDSTGSPFGDQRNTEPNSIVDAEMLLVLLLPTMPGQKYDLGNSVSADVNLAKRLNEMVGHDRSDSRPDELVDEVNDKIIELLMAFFERYEVSKDDSKVQTFSIGSYGEHPEGRALSTDEQPEIVDSYAMSLTLCICVLRLIASWKDYKKEKKRLKLWQTLELHASARLTASMRGLLSSFTLHVENRLNWEKETARRWEDNKDIDKVRDRLRRLGVTETELPIGMAFECGWSWGPVAEDHYIIPHSDDNEKKEWLKLTCPQSAPKWPAIAAPYLYFTVTALDCISDLNNADVMSGGLLNNEQLLLADRLRSLREVTSLYWSTLAFSEVKETSLWHIEEIPWRTADGLGSDYWTLYVLRMVGDKLPKGDTGIGRVIDLLEELAQRSRITRKPYPPATDPAIADIHTKGYRLDFEPEENIKASTISYRIYDFAPQMLKQAAQLLKMSLTDNHRMRVMRLIIGLSAHLYERSTKGTELSWDYPEKVYTDHFGKKNIKLVTNDRVSSWYFTERVMEALLARVEGEANPPKSSEQLRSLAAAALAEAEWRFGSESQGDDKNSIERKLSCARLQLDDDPLLALSVAVEIGGSRLKKFLIDKL